MNKKNIPFMLPDITQKEIKEITNTLKSGWLTTGKKTKEFEKKISKYCNSEKTLCLNSATACLELLLKLFEFDKNDEIITTAYTYCSTPNSIFHTGAKIVFVDVKKNSFNIDPKKIEKAINKNTKAIITVDIAGWPVDYDEIKEIISKNKNKYSPKKNTLQEKLDKPLFISDAAHSFGARYKDKIIGNQSDFTIFSFHATKNLTTAEGGAITFNSFSKIKSDLIYNKLALLSLHGQSKDAYSKQKAGAWKYSVDIAGYKYNMTDIAASIGLVQLERYEKEILFKRKKLFEFYINQFINDKRFIIPLYKNKIKESSYHLFPLRINNISEKQRDQIIEKMAEKNISLNVHFIPIIMQPFYKKLGYNIKNFPNTYNMYKNQISLPFYTNLNQKDAEYVALEIIKNLNKNF